MARHSVKEVEDTAIDQLNKPDTLVYLLEEIRSYENELVDLADSGEIIDGPRIWTFYDGSDFPRSDEDNAFVHNESFLLNVIAYDNSYGGAEEAALGDPDKRQHVGTREMIEDIKDRLLSQKPFGDAMPWILEEVRRIETSRRTLSAYRVSFRTEFDYQGPVT